MTNSSFHLEISESIGFVSAELTSSATPKAILTLAHGAGAGMQHIFMKSLSHELGLLDICTLRFNFPFMEQKKNRPDMPAVAHKTIDVAITKARELFPSVPLFVSGKSFGGRMSSQFIAKSNVSVKGIIFFGFPLHPAGNPSVERAAHLKEVIAPMLFIQGTRDALADLRLLKSVVEVLPLATLHLLERADHTFKSGKENLIPSIAKATEKWIDKIITNC